MSELFWTTHAEDIVERDTSDPLGIRSWANQLAEKLLPGFSRGTRRARGLELFLLGLSLSEASPGVTPKEAVERLERFAACATFILSQPRFKHFEVSGVSRASARVGRPHRGRHVSVVQPMVGATVLWGYKGLARHLQLITEDQGAVALTSLGEQVSSGACARADHPRLLSLVRHGSFVQRDAHEVRLDRRCGARNRALLTPVLAASPAGGGQVGDITRALSGREDGHQAIRLNCKAWLKELARAAEAAVHLTELVENRYREWLDTQSGRHIRAHHKSRDALRQITGLLGADWMAVELDAALNDRGDLERINRLQVRLARSRGRSPWQIGDVKPCQDSVVLAPDHRINALTSLLHDLGGFS